jgi:hypothetical protein
MSGMGKPHRSDPNLGNVWNGEGFLMRVAAKRCALARPRPALENLPRTKPWGSWIVLWGKCADGWDDGWFKGAAEGVHGRQDGDNHA